MFQTRTRQQTTLFLFACFVVVVYAVAISLAHRLSHFEKPGFIAIGITVDMVVIVPLAYYFLIVRRRGHSIVRLAPVVILSLVIASLVLPSGQQRALHVLEKILIPVELGLIGWIIWRTIGSFRQAKLNETLDPLERFRSAAFELFQNNLVAGAFASEIAVFYYSFGSWRSQAHCPVGAKAFSHHRRSGLGGIVFAFLFLMAGEGFALHFVLLNWSSLAAWIFSLSTIYGAIWLIADYRATILRPILVKDERLLIRAGLRYTLDVPKSIIKEVNPKQPAFGKESLNLKLMGAPTHWIVFSKPVVAQGPYGTRRRVRAVGIEPDDQNHFVSGLGL